MNQKNERRRLGEMLRLSVRFANGRSAGFVTDVRLGATDRVRGLHSELATEGLVVGRRRHGSMLGYDRKPEQGPLMVRLIVRALHRHTGYVPWTDVRDIDWDERVLNLRVDRLDRLESR